MSRDTVIREAAYAIWEAEGKPDGRSEEHWQQAERHVAASAETSVTQAKPKRAAPAKAAKAAKP